MASSAEKLTAGKRPYDKNNGLAKGANKPEKKPLFASNYQQMLNKRKEQLMANEVDCSGPIAHEAHILEAIDQMRKRKARPDVDRICNYMLKHYRVDVDNTVEDLARLIIIEKVIEVDYKGNTSYRNASKWTKLQTYKQATSQGMVKEKINLELVTSVLTELVIDEPDYLDHGVPSTRLIEHLLDGVMNPTSKRIVKDFLNKEVSNGNVVRLSNGNFSLTNPKQPDRSMINNVTSTNNLSQSNGETDFGRKNSMLSLLKHKRSSSLSDGNVDEDYNLNTLKLSKQSSKSQLKGYFKMFSTPNKNKMDEEKFSDTIDKFTNGSYYNKEDNLKQNGRINSTNSPTIKEDIKSGEPQVQQKKSKAERKQRLYVRSDDSTDLQFKFEDDYKKDNNYKDEDRREDVNDRLSEDEECEHDAGRDSTNPSPTPSNANAGNFRSARRKRAKKVFDPSDNMVVKKKRGRQPNSAKQSVPVQEYVKPIALKESPKDPNRTCSLCSKDKQESLIACRDCTVRAHPSCIYSPEEIIPKSSTSWQCERCKTCVICYDTSDAGPLVTCFNCDDAYHHNCHAPRIPASKTKWLCNECNSKQYKSTSKNLNSHSANNSSEQSNLLRASPPLLNFQVSPIRVARENMDDDNSEDIDPNIPDASDWTVDQVYQYFARLFPKEADVFRNEQIDGPSLMLLQRADVVQTDKNKGLGLLLGPGLKMWRHVIKLQLRKDDTRNYWL